MSKQLVRSACLAIVAGVGTAEAAEIVVLESTSPRYVAGQIVDAAQAVRPRGRGDVHDRDRGRAPGANRWPVLGPADRHRARR